MKFGQNVYLDIILNNFENGSCRVKKLGHEVKSWKKPCVCSRGHIFSLIIMELSQNVCLDKISYKYKIGHVWLKTRSLGQLLEKPCVGSRGHIFSPIIMEFVQNVCLDGISDEYEKGSCCVKN